MVERRPVRPVRKRLSLTGLIGLLSHYASGGLLLQLDELGAFYDGGAGLSKNGLHPAA